MDSIIIKVIVIVNTNQWYPHHIKLYNIAADINIIVFFVLAGVVANVKLFSSCVVHITGLILSTCSSGVVVLVLLISIIY